MRRRIRWSDPATAGLLKIPSYLEATRVAGAVREFARHGQGDLVRLPSDHSVTVRLHVHPYFVRMTVDPIEGVIHVLAVYRL